MPENRHWHLLVLILLLVTSMNHPRSKPIKKPLQYISISVVYITTRGLLGFMNISISILRASDTSSLPACNSLPHKWWMRISQNPITDWRLRKWTTRKSWCLPESAFGTKAPQNNPRNHGNFVQVFVPKCCWIMSFLLPMICTKQPETIFQRYGHLDVRTLTLIALHELTECRQ